MFIPPESRQKVLTSIILDAAYEIQSPDAETSEKEPVWKELHQGLWSPSLSMLRAIECVDCHCDTVRVG